MDDLTFTVDRNVLSSTITVTATNRNEHKYQVEVKNAVSCQYPKITLTKKACIEIISNKIKKEDFTYFYKEEDDVIVLTIEYLPDRKIVLVLDRCVNTGTDLRNV